MRPHIRSFMASVLIIAMVMPAFAQSSVVADVKAALVARGVPLSGPCGAFQIVKRVAWQLRGSGVGLLSKPAGNNCDGYSVDFLTYPDGSGYDILGDAGGANVPGWDLAEPPGALTGRWRAPFDPGDTVTPPPVVGLPPSVPPPSDRLAIIEQAVAEIRQNALVYHAEDNARVEALRLQLKAHDEAPSWVASVLGNRYVQIGLASFATWMTTQQVTK